MSLLFLLVPRTSFPWTRLGFGALVVVSLGLGWWGLALDTSHLPGRTWYDVVYHDLQLFVMGADPASGGGELSWQLQVARFLAPGTAVYALFEAARALFTGEIRRFRDRRARGHAIVVGQTDAADTVTAALRPRATGSCAPRTPPACTTSASRARRSCTRAATTAPTRPPTC